MIKQEDCNCGNCKHLLKNGGKCPRFKTTAKERSVICHYYFIEWNWSK